MQADVTPELKSVTADAKDRAWRTLLQGFTIDVATAVALGVGPIILSNDFAFTKAYWIIVVTSASKSLVQAVVAFFMRKLISPKV